MRRFVALVAGAALLLSPACSRKTDEAARAAGLTPASAVAFFSVNLDPANEQKSNLLSILRKFPGAREKVRGDFEDARDQLLSELMEDSGLDYTKDVKPWLGDEVAVSVLRGEQGDPVSALFIKSKDDDKARDALEKSERAGELEGQYRLIDGFAVISDQDDEAVDRRSLDTIARQADRDDGALADSDDFTKVVDELRGNRLLLGWVSSRQVLESMEESGEAMPGLDLTRAFRGSGSAAFDLHAADSAVVLEGVSEVTEEAPEGDPELTRGLPRDTLGAATFFDLRAAAEEGLKFLAGTGEGDPVADLREATGLDLQADILSWMGGEAVLVAGSPPAGQPFPDVGLVIEPTDRARAEAAMAKIRTLLADRAEVPLEQRTIAGARAYVVPEQVGPGLQPAMALFEDRFVAANRPQFLEALARSHSPGFDDSGVYKAILGSASSKRTSFQLVADIDPIREAIESGMGGSDVEYDREVKPNLEPLDAFGMFARRDGKMDRFELKLTFD